MRIDIDNIVLPEPEAVILLRSEVRRLRAAITALAAEDATLTVEERAAVAYYIGTGGPYNFYSTLVSLLERTA